MFMNSIIDPDIMVQILSTIGCYNLTAGTNFSLICSVDGITSLRPQLDFEWMQFDGMNSRRVGTNSSELHFSSLKLSDAGEYMCTVNISSSLLNSDKSIMSELPCPIRVIGKLLDVVQAVGML